MSIQAAKLFATVGVQGGAASSAALKGVGNDATKAQSALSRFSGIGGVASRSLGLVEKGASGVGSAFGHLKGTIGGLLTGPLGFLGLGAGVLGLAGALKSGIDTASTMALSIEKLTALTGESAQAMSGLMAVTGKYGVSSGQLSTIVGFEEKTVGKLAGTYTKAAKAGKSAALQSLENRRNTLLENNESTKKIDVLIKEQKAQDALTAAHSKALPTVNKLQALQKQYGVSLTDASGKALDFSTILNHVSDYYNSNATQGQKAALAATLFGRGYAAMIPVLQLGSKGFAEAQSAAEGLGLTLTDSNARDLMKYQETMRNLGDAVGGVQLQLSLALIPALEDVAKTATSFVDNNRQGIVSFFNTLIADSRTAAGFLTGTVIPDMQSLASAAIGFWNSIPPDFRDILVKGLVADRAIKFLLGFDPLELGLKIGGSFLTSIAGGLAKSLGLGVTQSLASAGIGKAFVQPVFVTNPGFGVGGGGGGIPPVITPGGAVAEEGLISKLFKFVPWVAVAAALASDPNLNYHSPTSGTGQDLGKIDSAVRDNEIGSAAGYGHRTLGPVMAAFASSQQQVIGRLSASEHADATKIAGELARLNAHEAAKKAVGGAGKSFHDFLLLFRSGNAKVALANFGKEQAYLATASDAQKKSPTFLQGIKENIAAMQRAMVGATTTQRNKLSADILAMKALLPKSNAALNAIKDKLVAANTKLQELKDKDLHITLNANMKVDGSTLAKVVLTYAGGKRLA